MTAFLYDALRNVPPSRRLNRPDLRGLRGQAGRKAATVYDWIRVDLIESGASGKRYFSEKSTSRQQRKKYLPRDSSTGNYARRLDHDDW